MNEGGRPRLLMVTMGDGTGHYVGLWWKSGRLYFSPGDLDKNRPFLAAKDASRVWGYQMIIVEMSTRPIYEMAPSMGCAWPSKWHRKQDYVRVIQQICGLDEWPWTWRLGTRVCRVGVFRGKEGWMGKNAACCVMFIFNRERNLGMVTELGAATNISQSWLLGQGSPGTMVI